MYIGQKVKEMRQRAKLTLAELAEQSGVQIATLSRIENLKMVGTLDSHMKIAKVLGVEVTDLYSDLIKEEKRLDVGKGEAAADVFRHSDRSSYEILTRNVLSKKLMPILLKIDPGGKTSVEQDPPGTEKFVYVLEGSIQLMIGEETVPLSPASTVYFDSNQKYHFINKGKSKGRVLCVSTPVNL
jgi:transcriptional regulator with XRE-family HTH domain